MIKKWQTLKAEVSMKVAGFILKNHKNALLKWLAKSAAWVNRKQYGSDALDFLEHEESRDHLDYSENDPK